MIRAPCYTGSSNDDGPRWPADVLDQWRTKPDGSWRVVVRFTTEPGSTYVLAMPADQCRPFAEAAR
jgi:hypothetical protein